MFIVGILFAILCVGLFFISKVNWLKILASVLVIAIGFVFVNQGIAQRKADQVANNITGQFGSEYDDKYLGSDNSSTEDNDSPIESNNSSTGINKSTISQNNNKSNNSNGSKKSSQINLGRNVNSNNNNSSRQTIGLKDKYLKRLKELEKKTDNMRLNSGQTMVDMSCTGVEIYELWDDELNVIYQEIRSYMSESQREALKQEERAWLKYRDETAEEDGAEYRGGSMEGLARSSSSAESTRKRCYELVNKYMN